MRNSKKVFFIKIIGYKNHQNCFNTNIDLYEPVHCAYECTHFIITAIITPRIALSSDHFNNCSASFSCSFWFRSIANQQTSNAMEPMPTSKRVLMYLNLYPGNSELSKRMRIIRRILPLIFIVVVSSAILGCGSYIIKPTHINAEATIFTAMVALVYVGLVFLMAFAFLSRSDITFMFEHLSEIYHSGQYTDFYYDKNRHWHFAQRGISFVFFISNGSCKWCLDWNSGTSK